MAVRGLAESTSHSSMAEEADEPNVLLPHLWKATTMRDGLCVHEGIVVGLCGLHPGMEN